MTGRSNVQGKSRRRRKAQLWRLLSPPLAAEVGFFFFRSDRCRNLLRFSLTDPSLQLKVRPLEIHGEPGLPSPVGTLLHLYNRVVPGLPGELL